MSKKNRNNYEVTENVENEDLSESVEAAVESEVQETEEHEALKSVPVRKYEVTAKEALNIRSAPKIDNNVVGIIGRGIIVDAPLVDGEVQVDGDFTYVIAEGAVGFAMSKFLKEV